MTARKEIFIVRAFCGESAKGNPAGVHLLKESLPDRVLQSIATQINLSETAFVLPQKDGHFTLRWFTPTCEVKLCGHATLASAFILCSENKVGHQKMYFDTLSGTLEVQKISPTEFELYFPRDSLFAVASVWGLKEALKCEVVEIYQGDEDYLIVLEDDEKVKEVEPDFEKLKKIKTRGFIVTSKTNRAGFDFVSRFFAPSYGIQEDAVTGSAHRTLGEYWSKRLGSSTLRGYQLSTQGGIVNVRIEKNNTCLSGQACLEGKVEIFID